MMVSGRMVEEAARTLSRAAKQMEKWALESVKGGWSTHQVDTQRRMAAKLREQARRLKDEVRVCRM